MTPFFTVEIAGPQDQLAKQDNVKLGDNRRLFCAIRSFLCDLVEEREGGMIGVGLAEGKLKLSGRLSVPKSSNRHCITDHPCIVSMGHR